MLSAEDLEEVLAFTGRDGPGGGGVDNGREAVGNDESAPSSGFSSPISRRSATAIGDGGLATTVRRPLEDARQLARALVDLAGRPANLTILERSVNGRPGLIAQQDGVIVTVYAFDVTDDRITRIWAVPNPEKLRPWTVGHHT
ncbi:MULTISPECIES: hypothetical protein [unclassified Streptomyces]|uniref:hypothetical protein n=1 Tax=unclassified Streptomyces TaxID=2593676 RepID=UPI0028842B27|nr:hypothetical protein [Streptomyces sp. DSM 41633]